MCELQPRTARFKKYWLSSAILLGVCATRQGADPQSVWDQAIQAKGGRERLRNVHTLAVYMKPAQVLLAGPPANWLCVFPNRYFEWEGGKGMERAIVVDAAADRVAMDANGKPRSARKLTVVERDRLTLNQLLYLLDTAWLRPEPVEGKPGGMHLRKHTVVTVRAGGRTFDVFLNSANLPERVFSDRSEDSKAKYDYQLDHYREFQGIQLPREYGDCG